MNAARPPTWLKPAKANHPPIAEQPTRSAQPRPSSKAIVMKRPRASSDSKTTVEWIDGDQPRRELSLLP
jgi:hypothetical protein